MPFTKEEKKHWFRSREGILFGFGVGFYALLRVPLLGVLIYGLAEASTAFLVTKITDPPPPPDRAREFATSQQEWQNRQKFLSLSLANIDALHDSHDKQLPPVFQADYSFLAAGDDAIIAGGPAAAGNPGGLGSGKEGA